MTEMPTTGMITPQTVMPLILPVMRAPPKLATVASHSTPMVAIQIPSGLSVVSNSSVP
jgi:hypothetical protein